MPEQPIDMSHLERYTTGDPALLDEILGIFCDHLAACLSRLTPDADDHTWRETCHSLKGAARGVGAWRLGDLAHEAEGLIASVPGFAEARVKTLGILYEAARAAESQADAIRAEACAVG